MEGKANGNPSEFFLDDGANTQYCDESYAQHYNLPRIKLRNPFTLGLATLSAGGQTISEMTEVDVNVGGHYEKIRFFIVKNLGYDFTLGSSWHACHMPTKNWKDKTLHFLDHGCQGHSIHTHTSVPAIPQPRSRPFSERPLHFRAATPFPLKAIRSSTSTSINAEEKLPEIEEVSPQAFGMYARRKGAVVHALYLNPKESSQHKSPTDPFTAQVLKAHSMTSKPVRCSNTAFACAMLIEQPVAEAIEKHKECLRKIHSTNPATACAMLAPSDVEKFMKGKDKHEDVLQKLPKEYHDWADC